MLRKLRKTAASTPQGRLRKSTKSPSVKAASSKISQPLPPPKPPQAVAAEEAEAAAAATAAKEEAARTAAAAAAAADEAARCQAVALLAVSSAEDPVVATELSSAVEAVAEEEAASRAAAAAAKAAAAAAQRAARAQRKLEAAQIMSGKSSRREKASSSSSSSSRRSTRGRLKATTQPCSRSSLPDEEKGEEEEAATMMDDELRAMAEAATARLAILAETVGGAVSGALAQAIARASGYTEEQQEATVRLQRFQRSRLTRRQWERFGDYYWQHVYDLQRERAASTVQRRVRACWAGREARATCADLRGWEMLLWQLGEARRQRVTAIVVLQRWVRARKRLRRAREWRKAELRKRSSKIWERTQHFAKLREKEQQAQQLNPFSKTYYVGAEQHRKVVEAQVGGKLRRFGKPSKAAADKALHGQVATMLNMLRLVDSVNAVIISRGLEYTAGVGHARTSGHAVSTVPVDSTTPMDGTTPVDAAVSPTDANNNGGGCDTDGDTSEQKQSNRATNGHEANPSLHFDDLVRWNDGSIQQRFSGVVQYLRSAKRQGFLNFEGEMPQGALITSRCMHWSRQALLDAALSQIHLVVPTLPQPPGPNFVNESSANDKSAEAARAAAEDLRRRIATEFVRKIEEFTSASSETDATLSSTRMGGCATLDA